MKDPTRGDGRRSYESHMQWRRRYSLERLKDHERLAFIGDETPAVPTWGQLAAQKARNMYVSPHFKPKPKKRWKLRK